MRPFLWRLTFGLGVTCLAACLPSDHVQYVIYSESPRVYTVVYPTGPEDVNRSSDNVVPLDSSFIMLDFLSAPIGLVDFEYQLVDGTILPSYDFYDLQNGEKVHDALFVIDGARYTIHGSNPVTVQLIGIADESNLGGVLATMSSKARNVSRTVDSLKSGTFGN